MPRKSIEISQIEFDHDYLVADLHHRRSIRLALMPWHGAIKSKWNIYLFLRTDL